MCFIFVEILGFYMFMVKLCIYLCMYLLQVVLRPPQLGIESDLFLAKEVQFEPAVYLFQKIGIEWRLASETYSNSVSYGI